MSVCQTHLPQFHTSFSWREFPECTICFGPFQHGVQLQVYSYLESFSSASGFVLIIIIASIYNISHGISRTESSQNLHEGNVIFPKA